MKYDVGVGDVIQQALADLQDILPSEDEMNAVRETIKNVENALKKLPIEDSRQPTYIVTTSEDALLGWHITKRKIYYKDKAVYPRPLMECKFFVRKQMIQFLPDLITKMRTLI